MNATRDDIAIVHLSPHLSSPFGHDDADRYYSTHSKLEKSIESNEANYCMPL